MTDSRQTPEHRLGIAELSALHAALARALGEAGLGGPEAEKIFADAIAVECVGCRIRITGTELGQIALVPVAEANTGSKLGRLRLGYCARQGCGSRFYRVECAPLDGIDSASLLTRAMALKDGPPPEPDPPGKPVTPWWKVPKLRLVAGLGVVFVLVVAKIAVSNGLGIPGVRSEPAFETFPPGAVTEAL